MNKQYEGQCMVGIHPDFVILYVFFFKPDLNLQAVLWLRRLLVGLPATEDRFQSQASTFGSYDVVLLFSLVLLIPPEIHTHFTSAAFLPTMVLTRNV